MWGIHILNQSHSWAAPVAFGNVREPTQGGQFGKVACL